MKNKQIVLIIVGDAITEYTSQEALKEALEGLVENEILFSVNYRYEEESAEDLH